MLKARRKRVCADHYTIGGLDPHNAFGLVQPEIGAAPVHVPSIGVQNPL